VTRQRLFGISTHLYHDQRLGREHLLEIAAHGFETVELFATRTHFDYHNPASVADLQQWLGEAELELHGIHAPITDGSVAGRGGPPLTIASADPDARTRALAEAERALWVARRIPVKVLVAHLGVPRSQQGGPGDNNRDAARRSVEQLQRMAAPLGVQIAIEVIPNDLSRPGSLVHFIEEELGLEEADAPDVGICLDFGHAHMDGGDLVDAIETVSGHLATTHLHDNRGRADEHLVPFQGTIDWPAALTAIQKVGYDGTLLLEIAPVSSAREALQRARKARERMERLLIE
jgi:sugar phosphate isomerase/epimerase